MTLRAKALTLSLFALGLALGSCNKAKEAKSELLKVSNSDLQNVIPDQIIVSPAQVSLSEGDVIRLSATGIYPYGEVSLLEKDVRWTSDNAAVVSIDANGLVRALKAGTAILSVERLGVTQQVATNIKPASLAQIIIFPEKPSITLSNHLGSTLPKDFGLEVYGLMTDGKLEDIKSEVTWETQLEDAISLEAGGGFKAKKPGKWNLIAHYHEFQQKKLVHIDMRPLDVVRFEPLEDPFRLRLGDIRAIPLRAIMNDDSVSTTLVGAVISAADSRLKVQGNRIEASGIGPSALNVKMGSQTFTLKAYVDPPAVLSLTLDQEAIALHRGERRSFIASAQFSDGSSADLTTALASTSSNPAVATVSGNTIEAVSLGAAILTVAYRGVSTQVLINVGTPILAKIEVRPAAIALSAGRSASYAAIGIYTNGAEIDLTSLAQATVLQASRAEISAPGTVLSKSKGNTSLSVIYIDPVTTRNLSGVAALSISDALLESVSFDPPSADKPAGRYEEFRVKGHYSDNTEVDISNDVSVTTDTYSPGYSYAATVARNSLGHIRVTGITVGNILIKARLGTISGSVVYRSGPKILDSVYIQRIPATGAPAVLVKGQSTDFAAIGVYSDSSQEDVTLPTAGRTVTWGSPDPSIATFVASGSRMHMNGIFQGPASINVSVVDATQGLTFANGYGINVNIPCGGNGSKTLGYFCYYLGNAGDSCNQTCSAVGRAYEGATSYYSGSLAGAGGDQVCSDFFSIHYQELQTSFDNDATATKGIGCAMYEVGDVTIGLREWSVVTDGASFLPNFRRFCSCE